MQDIYKYTYTCQSGNCENDQKILHWIHKRQILIDYVLLMCFCRSVLFTKNKKIKVATPHHPDNSTTDTQRSELNYRKSSSVVENVHVNQTPSNDIVCLNGLHHKPIPIDGIGFKDLQQQERQQHKQP